MHADVSAVGDYFYAIEPLAWTPDRLYRIYPTDRGFAFGYVAGQMYDERAARWNLQGLYPFVRRLVSRWLEARKALEACYTGVDPTSSVFLQVHGHNYSLLRTDVARVEFHCKRSWRYPNSIGWLQLEDKHGAKRKYFAIDGQNQGDVIRLLLAADSTIQVAGDYHPKAKTVAETLRQRIISRIALAAVLVFMAVSLVAIYLIQGKRAGIQVGAFAFVNLAAASWLLVEARRIHKGSKLVNAQLGEADPRSE